MSWPSFGRPSRRTTTLASLGIPLIAGAAIATMLTGGDKPLLSAPRAASDAGGPVPNEAYLWRPVAVGGGGYITGYSSDRANKTFVARTDVHGAYRWDAALNRWTQIVTADSMPSSDRFQAGMNEGVYEIAVAPSDGRRVYMAIKGRVYRSEDAGQHWTLPDAAAPFPLKFDPNSEFRLSGPFMAVSPANKDLVLLGTPEDGLWRSADGGATWARIDGVPAAADLRPDPGTQSPGIAVWFDTKGGRVLAASPGQGVFAADGQGLSFAPTTAAGAPQPRIVTQGSFAGDGSFYAVDGESDAAWVLRGRNWINLDKAGLPAAPYAGVAANPRGDKVYVTDKSGKAWCSVDSGRSWSGVSHRARVGEGEPPWLHLTDTSYFSSGQIRFDPTTPDQLWVAAGAGPYHADTAGGCTSLTWFSQVRGIEELVANDVVQRPGRAPLFAGWDFGIHVKPDLNAFSTTFGPKERMLISAQQIDWSPIDPGFVVTNASDARVGCCSEDGDSVLAGYSGDGGQTWRKFANLPTPPGTKPNDPWRMSFGTIAVSANDVDNIVWAPAYNRSPFYTLDRGRTWQRVVLAGEHLPLTGSFPHLYGSRKTLAADRVKPATFYLFHSGEAPNSALAGVWRTADGGAHWEHVFSGELAPNSLNSAKLRAVPGRAGHLFFASGGYGSDTRLRRSVDGGATWTALVAVDHVDDVAFGKAAPGAGYPSIYVSGQVNKSYGVWRSVDDAKTWQRIAQYALGTLDQVTVIEADKDVFGRVYVGYMGSGWQYGEPAPCRVTQFHQGADHDCEAVQPPVQ
jgi:photosystem II stability/assembly factor-like uncharacterized protein